MLGLSVVVVTCNAKTLTLECLGSLYANLPSCPAEIIVVDNASTDGTLAAVRTRFPDVKLVENRTNTGFSAANNTGILIARFDQILLLNSDTIMKPGALDGMLTFARLFEPMSVVAPMLLNGDGSWQRSYFNFPNAAKIFVHTLALDDLAHSLLDSKAFGAAARHVPRMRLYQATKPSEAVARPVPYVILACALVHRAVFDKIGLLDSNMFFYHEDCEFGYRLAKHEIQVWWTPHSHVIHLGGGSSRRSAVAYESYYRGLVYVFTKHESRLHTLALRSAVIAAFAIRSVLTLFGAYRDLEIPTTYSHADHLPKECFAPAFKRSIFYFRMALVGLSAPNAWRGTVN